MARKNDFQTVKEKTTLQAVQNPLSADTTQKETQVLFNERQNMLSIFLNFKARAQMYNENWIWNYDSSSLVHEAKKVPKNYRV